MDGAEKPTENQGNRGFSEPIMFINFMDAISEGER